MKIKATRYHDISCGHRVVGHESKCRHLHGHNYRVTFACEADDGTTPVDSIGRVIDFSVIKAKLCMWLEDNWDHKFLVWNDDPMASDLRMLAAVWEDQCGHTFVRTPFNPTAENMAAYLLQVVAPAQLAGTGVRVTSVVVSETRKCSASAEI